MPINKKESLIYTAMMCLFMVYFMSVYNLSYQMGLSVSTFQIAWNELPIAIIVAFILDWFVVSKPAKGIAFKFINNNTATWKKIVLISSFMVIGMVLFMSLFGAFMHPSDGMNTMQNWGTNILKNIIFALPLQLIIAGPIVRKLFRTFFPVGIIQEPEAIKAK